MARTGRTAAGADLVEQAMDLVVVAAGQQVLAGRQDMHLEGLEQIGLVGLPLQRVGLNLRPKVTFGSFSYSQIAVGVHWVMVRASLRDLCGITSATSITAMFPFSAWSTRSNICALRGSSMLP